jgi:hypothetical protein
MIELNTLADSYQPLSIGWLIGNVAGRRVGAGIGSISYVQPLV